MDTATKRKREKGKCDEEDRARGRTRSGGCSRGDEERD